MVIIRPGRGIQLGRANIGLVVNNTEFNLLTNRLAKPKTR
jgi:hypothetical protein